MKKTKVIPCLLAAALIAASFAGCGDSASASTDKTSQTQEQQQDQQQPQDQRGTMAKVVSLEGDTITVLLADMPAGKGDGAQPPADGGQKNGGPQGDAPGQGGGQIQFTDEQVTFTLSDDVKITKGMGDNAAEIDLSEVAADSVISFTTADDNGNEVISSIQVME